MKRWAFPHYFFPRILLHRFIRSILVTVGPLFLFFSLNSSNSCSICLWLCSSTQCAETCPIITDALGADFGLEGISSKRIRFGLQGNIRCPLDIDRLICVNLFDAWSYDVDEFSHAVRVRVIAGFHSNLRKHTVVLKWILDVVLCFCFTYVKVYYSLPRK